MLLEVVPGEHFQELVEILLDVLHRELALVDGVEPAFEERLGHLQPGFLDEVVTQLHREEIVALAAQLAFDLSVDELVEPGLVGHSALRESHLEELLVQLRFGELADLGDFQLEFGVDALQFVLLDLQAGGALGGILVEFVEIDLHLGADLLADERLALLVRHRDQTHVGVGHVHLAVVERHGQRLVRSHLVGVHQAAEAAQVVRTVVVVHLLVHLDLAVSQLILVGELQVDGGSLADLEHEFELRGVIEIEIEIALLLRGDHVAQVVDLLLFEILESGVRRLAVRLLGQDALAVHLLDKPHRHHARAETGDIGLALVLAQGLLDLLSVIGLADSHADQRVILAALFSYNVHNE